METLLIYLANASAGIVLFYAVYWFFLRKETFHLANRWYLFMALLTAILLPVFPIQYTLVVEASSEKGAFSTIADTFKHLPVVSGTEESEKTFSWIEMLLIVYFTGAVIFLSRLLIQTYILLHLIVKHQIRTFSGMKIVENEKYGLPFSFFNIVFINPKFHTQDDLPEILAHEKVHIRENHWFDLLFIELLTVIFWFNPFIWLFERSIKQNHEYLADQGVLTRGLDLSRYQALLINQLMGMQIIGVTNNLNFALNTNRFKMMTKIQSKKIRSIKLIVALPVLFLLMVAFAKPNYVPESNLVMTNSEVPGFIMKEKVTVEGVVKAENGEPLPGASVVIKGTTIGAVTNIDGKFTLEVPEGEKAVVVISFVGFITEEIVVSEPKNGKAKTETVLKRGQIFIETQDAEQILNTPPPPPPPPVPETKKQDGEEVFIIVEELPSYPGGHYALMQYYTEMKKNLKGKLFFKGEKAEGKALVGFTVNSKGKVTNINVLKKDNDTVAKAAVTLVQDLKDWNPGKQRGKSVSVDYVLPFSFD